MTSPDDTPTVELPVPALVRESAVQHLRELYAEARADLAMERQDRERIRAQLSMSLGRELALNTNTSTRWP